MALFADQLWKIVSLPYAEYWIPLGIGLAIGFTFLVMVKGVFGWHARVAPPPPPKADPAKEYDPFVQGSPTEQRKSFRRTGNPIEVLYALPDNKKQAAMGWVFDRSMGGIGLVCNEEMEAGVVLAVRPASAPEIVPWIEVEIRSCRPARNCKGFEIGCKFVKTPPWSVLLMFG